METLKQKLAHVLERDRIEVTIWEREGHPEMPWYDVSVAHLEYDELGNEQPRSDSFRTDELLLLIKLLDLACDWIFRHDWQHSEKIESAAIDKLTVDASPQSTAVSSFDNSVCDCSSPKKRLDKGCTPDAPAGANKTNRDNSLLSHPSRFTVQTNCLHRGLSRVASAVFCGINDVCENCVGGLETTSWMN